jgi:uncharacterized DUF497 family protein
VDLRFEWDENKNRANITKHGIDFRAAIPVFDDPFVLLEQDRDVGGEQRWVAMGWGQSTVLLLVAHAVKTGSGGVTIRIISARAATRGERKRYEENCNLR